MTGQQVFKSDSTQMLTSSVSEWIIFTDTEPLKAELLYCICNSRVTAENGKGVKVSASHGNFTVYNVLTPNSCLENKLLGGELHIRGGRCHSEGISRVRRLLKLSVHRVKPWVGLKFLWYRRLSSVRFHFGPAIIHFTWCRATATGRLTWRLFTGRQTNKQTIESSY